MHTIKKEACLKNLDSLLAYVRKIAFDNGFEESRVWDFNLGLEEIIVNIISYAYPDTTGKIVINCEFIPKKEALSVQISDTGIPFNILDAEKKDNDGDLEVIKHGGFGIILAKSVLNEITYTRKKEKNQLNILINK